jgi:hypothetical protein
MGAIAGEDEDILNGDVANSPRAFCNIGPTWPDVSCAIMGGFFYTQIFKWEVRIMEFFTSAVSTLRTLVIALGAGLAVWGVINLLEGYDSGNPGANVYSL